MSPFSAMLPTLTLLMLGAVCAGALSNLWIWLHRRQDTLHLWAAGWCAITGSYLICHYVQLMSETPERVVLSSRLTWVCALLITVVSVGLTQTLVRGKCSRRSIGLLSGLNAVLVLVTLLTNLIATDQIYQRTDRLGGQYWAPVPGALMIILAPYLFAVFIYCFMSVWRAKQLERGERGAFLVSFSVYIAAGLNDALHAARYIESTRVFDYAFMAVAFGLGYLVLRRYTRLSDGLETEVAAQTFDLQIRQEHLGALVRAGQVVMAGLDLTQILTRLTEEASRISGAPHVAVLLRDGDSRTLRLAASTGGTFPPGYKIEAGQSLSGEVAERGEAIYVADVTADPRNTHPERDRAAGIVAYLGLPIKKADAVLGVIVLKTIAPRTFDPEELAILTSFAQQAAIAIENARLYSALDDRAKRLDTLTGLNRLISSSLDTDRILKHIADAAAELMAGSLAIVWSADEARQTIQARAMSDTPTVGTYPLPTMRFGEGVMGWVVQNRRPLTISDLARDPRLVKSQWFLANDFRSCVAVPILRGDKLVGGLLLLFRDSSPPKLEDDPLLHALIDQAGIAIEHAGLYSTLENRVRRLDTLTGLNQSISESLDVNKILKQIADAAAALMEAGLVIVWSADEARQTIQARAMSDTPTVGTYPLPTMRFGEGVIGWVAQNRRPLSVPHLATDPRLIRSGWFVTNDFQSCVAMPIMRGNELLGGLSVFFRGSLPLNLEGDPLLQAFIGQAGIAIEHARLYTHLAEHVRDLQTVTRLNRLISSSLESDRVLSEITKAAAQLPGVVGAAIWLASEEKRTLHPVSFSDPAMYADWPFKTMTFEQGVLGWVARHGRLLNVPDAFADGRFAALDWWRSHELKSFVGLPVILDGVLLAVLSLNGREPFELDPEAERLLESFGDQAALAIRNASLYAAEGAARQAAERALAEVTRLQGMLPICSYCKKIRNDQNSWEQMETYISEHSHATFSHGICPDCRSTVVARELEHWQKAR